MFGPPKTASSEVQMAIASCRGVFASMGLLSLVINLLMLTGPLFMLQVYDRVLNSNSVPTLVALTVLIAMLYGLYGTLEFIRQRIMVRIGRRVDEQLRGRIFDAVVTHALRRSTMAIHPTQDLVTVRQFISGSAPTSFLD